jgi:hypothetical protein
MKDFTNYTDFLAMEKDFLNSLELEKLLAEEDLINQHIFGPVAEC